MNQTQNIKLKRDARFRGSLESLLFFGFVSFLNHTI